MSRLVPRSDWESNISAKETPGTEKESVRLTRGSDWGEGSVPTSPLVHDKEHDVLFAGSANQDPTINNDGTVRNPGKSCLPPADAICPSMEQECLGTPVYGTGLTLGQVYALIRRDAKEERSRLYADLRDQVAPALERAAQQESIVNVDEVVTMAYDMLQTLRLDDADVVKRYRL